MVPSAASSRHHGVSWETFQGLLAVQTEKAPCEPRIPISNFLSYLQESSVILEEIPVVNVSERPSYALAIAIRSN